MISDQVETPETTPVYGKRHLKQEIEERRKTFGKKIVNVEPSPPRQKKETHVRIKIIESNLDRPMWNQTLEDDFVKIWKKVNQKDLRKHKFFHCVAKECCGKRSRDYLNYGLYGGKLRLDDNLKVMDVGEPIDALDFICYLRDENLIVDKKKSIEASRESSRVLSLHHRLKNFDSQQYAKSIIQCCDQRFGHERARNVGNESNIIFG